MEKTEIQPAVMTPTVAAKRLSICTASVYNLINRGELKVFRIPGMRKTLIRETDLTAFLNGPPGVGE